VADELAKLGSSRGTLPPKVFMQELPEPSISKELSIGNTAVGSVDNTATLADKKSDSSEVMMVDSDRRTLFMIYLKTRG
jgi:hypothetical protein